MNQERNDGNAMEINNRIIRALIDRGMSKHGTLSAFAKASGISTAEIQQLRARRATSPCLYTVIKLAAGLGMRVVITSKGVDKPQ